MTTFDVSTHSPWAVAEHICGLEPIKENSRYRMYRCPFHDDHRPSLSVTAAGVVHCFGGCDIGNREFSNVVGLVMQVHAVSFREAMQIIQGGNYSRPLKRPLVQKQGWKPDMAYVDKAARNLKLALPYLQSRGIPLWYARHMKLGIKIHTVKSLGYITLDRQKFDHLPCLRHTIPSFRTTPTSRVYGMSLRLDETDALERLQLLDSRVVDRVRSDILARLGGDIPDIQQELLYALFGPKYVTLGSGTTIFQSELLARWYDRWIYPAYPQLGVTESQYDAMLLTLYGFPTVATKGNPYLRRAFQAVEQLVIIRDNDAAGTDIGNRLLEQSGRKLGHDAIFLNPYPQHKDIGEMRTAGVLRDWMVEHDLAPLELERLKVA